MAPAIPKTHTAAIFKEAGKPLAIEDVETPQPNEGQVLIKVLATGVCHSDMMVQAGGFTSFPRIPGHETIGEVVALGPSEERWKVGDRVGGPWHGGHDGTCKWCKRGIHQVCPNAAINGVSRDGGYQEYCLLRSEAVVSIPPSLDPVQFAPFLCAGVAVFNSMRQQKVPAGEIVAIQGLGGLGHLAIQYAAKMGYKVVALSSSASKEKFARELGASGYVDGSKEDHASALQKMGGAAMIVATAPNPELFGKLQGGLEPLGKLLILAPGGNVQINTLPLVTQGQTVTGWPSGHAKDSEEAIEFASKNGIKCLVEPFPLADANKAFDAMASGNVRFRAVLTM